MYGSFCGISVLSVFKTIYLSLYKTNKMGEAKLFVGLGNYTELLSSASFRNSLKVTLIFVVIVVLGSMLLGLIAAVLCNKAFPGIRFFSTAYALPMAIASSSAAMIFQIMLHPSVGIVNKLLGLDINWLNDLKQPFTVWLFSPHGSTAVLISCIFPQGLEILMKPFTRERL